ncbi:hypothetical protein MLD52_12765 [Puniceicoccaceae bacterium K14]|nr:hypothetical protein [Puniceicoccaceae bacterium K14]
MEEYGKKLGMGFFSLQGGENIGTRLINGNLTKSLPDGRTRVHCPMYTKIKEFSELDFGTVVREDYYRLQGQSSIYVLDEELEFSHFIDCPGMSDVYSEPMQIEGELANLGSWRGFTFRVNLKTGEVFERAMIR